MLFTDDLEFLLKCHEKMTKIYSLMLPKLNDFFSFICANVFFIYILLILLSVFSFKIYLYICNLFIRFGLFLQKRGVSFNKFCKDNFEILTLLTLFSVFFYPLINFFKDFDFYSLLIFSFIILFLNFFCFCYGFFLIFFGKLLVLIFSSLLQFFLFAKKTLFFLFVYFYVFFFLFFFMKFYQCTTHMEIYHVHVKKSLNILSPQKFAFNFFLKKVAYSEFLSVNRNWKLLIIVSKPIN